MALTNEAQEISFYQFLDCPLCSMQLPYYVGQVSKEDTSKIAGITSFYYFKLRFLKAQVFLLEKNQIGGNGNFL